MPIQRVGVIGLGLMGAGIAKNLLEKGYSLTVLDLDPKAVDRLTALGATAAATPRQVSEKSELVITVVPDGPQVQEVILGPDGGLSGAKPGTIFMDCSTIDPAITQKVGDAVRKAGCRMVDAAMGRTSAQAEAGKLLYMVGATPEDYNEVLPVLQATGDTIFHCGGPSAGITMKMVNNLMNISLLAADVEGLVLGAKAGLSFDVMLKVLSSTAADNPHLRISLRDEVVPGRFEPGFKAVLAHKDLGLAQNMAARLGVPLFALAGARQLFSLALAQGKGDKSMSIIGQVLEDAAHTKIAGS
jgi:3-hydroxyisobutyrate dehydrogenase-like beta-hydroxyacid dehydrogenase